MNVVVTGSKHYCGRIANEDYFEMEYLCEIIKIVVNLTYN